MQITDISKQLWSIREFIFCLFLGFIFCFGVSVTQLSSDASKHLWLSTLHPLSPRLISITGCHQKSTLLSIWKNVLLEMARTWWSQRESANRTTHITQDFHSPVSSTLALFSPSHSSCPFRSNTDLFPCPVHGSLGIILVIYVCFGDFSSNLTGHRCLPNSSLPREKLADKMSSFSYTYIFYLFFYINTANFKNWKTEEPQVDRWCLSQMQEWSLCWYTLVHRSSFKNQAKYELLLHCLSHIL